MQKPSSVTREGLETLIVIRDFAAPRPRIWRAFTDADMLRHWLLGPEGWVMDHCHIDPRDGGSYAWAWRNPQTGDVFGFTGHYTRVRPQTLMVDRQSFHLGDVAAPIGDQTHNDVRFDDLPGGATRVTTRITYPDGETRELVLQQDMPAGMEAAYARLDAFLATKRHLTAAE